MVASSCFFPDECSESAPQELTPEPTPSTSAGAGALAQPTAQPVEPPSLPPVATAIPNTITTSTQTDATSFVIDNPLVKMGKITPEMATILVVPPEPPKQKCTTRRKALEGRHFTSDSNLEAMKKAAAEKKEKEEAVAKRKQERSIKKAEREQIKQQKKEALAEKRRQRKPKGGKRQAVDNNVTTDLPGTTLTLSQKIKKVKTQTRAAAQKSRRRMLEAAKDLLQEEDVQMQLVLVIYGTWDGVQLTK